MKNLLALFITNLIIFFFFTAASQARVLKVAVGLSIPPYVIKEESRGIEYDILQEALSWRGHSMEPVYVSLGRTLEMIKRRKVDGIMSTGQRNLPGCYTDPHITYWNFAITLKKNNYVIKSIDDLYDKRVTAFQNASKYLGVEFLEMSRRNRGYVEIPDQSSQNKLLYNNRTDVVVGDRYIFQWFNNEPDVKKYSDTTQEVTHHQLFAPSHFSAVFLDSEICSDFNIGLHELKTSGRYDEIISSYDLTEPVLID